MMPMDFGVDDLLANAWTLFGVGGLTDWPCSFDHFSSFCGHFGVYPLLICYNALLKMAQSKSWIYPIYIDLPIDSMVDLSIVFCMFPGRVPGMFPWWKIHPIQAEKDRRPAWEGIGSAGQSRGWPTAAVGGVAFGAYRHHGGPIFLGFNHVQ